MSSDTVKTLLTAASLFVALILGVRLFYQDRADIDTDVRIGVIGDHSVPANIGQDKLGLMYLELQIPVTYINHGNRASAIEGLYLFLVSDQPMHSCTVSNSVRYFDPVGSDMPEIPRFGPDNIPPLAPVTKLYKFTLFKGGLFLLPHASGLMCMQIDASDVNGKNKRTQIPVAIFHAESGEPIEYHQNPGIYLLPEIQKGRAFRIL